MLPNDENLDDIGARALPSRKEKVIAPATHANNKNEAGDDALRLIRSKLDAIYSGEPDVKEELREDASHHGRRSKHQQFMHELGQSGKSLAEIQTAWHKYYQDLPDDQKHKVWQEFYANYNKQPATTTNRRPQKQPTPQLSRAPINTETTKSESPEELKARIKKTVKERAAQKNHHFASIKFGVLSGLLVVFVLMFGFFNERVLTPFIRPSVDASVPLILEEGEEVGPEPMLIIPKINVQAPVVYDEESIEEEAVQTALERGVLHYATTPEPGQFGNSVIFGHSSNNILNSGAYKYVFVQLNKLETGDTFFIHKNGTRYVYKVFEKKIVSPDEVSVLYQNEKESTMTLITCDPPGTAINRLVVVGEQISPSPDENSESTAKTSQAVQPEILPSNSPSLWSRITGWF